MVLIQSSINGGSKYTMNAFSELNRPLGTINFSGNEVFENDNIFLGNRLLLKKGIQGIAEMCEIKKIESIKIKKIVSIATKEEYSLFAKEMN